MIIIRKNPLPNGAYGNQTWDGATPPDGYYALPESLESLWHQYAPFATLTVENDTITAIADNPEARAAQAAIDAAAVANTPPSTESDLMSLTVDHEYRLILLELGVI